LEWLKSIGRDNLGLPGFVVMEILEGESDKRSTKRIHKTLGEFAVFWPTVDNCNRAMEVFAEKNLSHSLGAFGALIGETAKGLGVPLCTFNLKHYNAIPGLETNTALH